MNINVIQRHVKSVKSSKPFCCWSSVLWNVLINSLIAIQPLTSDPSHSQLLLAPACHDTRIPSFCLPFYFLSILLFVLLFNIKNVSKVTGRNVLFFGNVVGMLKPVLLSMLFSLDSGQSSLHPHLQHAGLCKEHVGLMLWLLTGVTRCLHLYLHSLCLSVFLRICRLLPWTLTPVWRSLKEPLSAMPHSSFGVYLCVCVRALSVFVAGLSEYISLLK